MGSWIFILPPLQEFEELLRASLFKKTHERALHSLHLSTRDLGDPSITIHITSRNLFELQIASDVSVDEDFGEFTGRDDEFGNQIHSVVTVAPKLCGRRLIGPEFAIQLR